MNHVTYDMQVRAEQKERAETEARWLRANKRVDGWKQVLQSADRILTGLGMNVLTMYGKGVPYALQDTPGWSDGKDIYLNGKVIEEHLRGVASGKDTLSNFVLSLKGLNYHEVSHILYTPRISDPMGKWITERAQHDDRRYWWLFNSLEDTRIELLFSSHYGVARSYFTATVMRFIVQQGQHGAAQEADMLPLVWGRKYLPARVRGPVRRAFKEEYGAAMTTEVTRLLDEYTAIVYPDHTTQAQAIVTRLYTLLFHKGAQPTLGGCAMSDTLPDQNTRAHDSNHVKKGRAYVREQREAQEWAEDVRDAAAEADDIEEKEAKRAEREAKKAANQPAPASEEVDTDTDDDDGDDYEGSDSDFDGEDDVEGTGGTSGDGDGEGDGDDSDDSEDGDGAGDGDGTGTGDGDPDTSKGQPKGAGGHQGGVGDDSGNHEIAPRDDVWNRAANELDTILNDDQFKADVNATAAAAAARAKQEGAGPTGKSADFNLTRTVDVDARLAISISQVLRELRTDLQPTWVHQQSTGRVNFREVMKPQLDSLDVFDTWDEGAEEEATIECYVLLDLSTSMGGCITEASRAMWTVKRAMDLSGIKTTVLGYSDGHRVLYKPSEKVKPKQYRHFNVISGTEPEKALRQALNQLTRSSATNKVVISITDGGWQDESKSEPLVLALNNAGVYTVLLGLDRAVQNFGTHHHKVARDIEQPKDIVKVVEDLVTHIMRKVRMQHSGI